MAQMFGVAHIGRDAEVRFTQAGEPVVSLSLAFSYGKKENGQRPTQWVDGALWGKRGEAMAPYLLKGQQVGVTLSDVHIETFTKGDGTQGVKLAGKVTEIEFAGGPTQQQGQQQQAPRQAQQQQQRPPQQQQAQQQNQQGTNRPNQDEFSDDIPFHPLAYLAGI